MLTYEAETDESYAFFHPELLLKTSGAQKRPEWMMFGQSVAGG